MSTDTNDSNEEGLKVVQEWNVESENEAGLFYRVKKYEDDSFSCECKHWQFRCSKSGKDCKHIAWAKRHPDQANGSIGDTIKFALYRGSKVKREGDIFYVPLVPADDSSIPLIMTFAYDLLQEGVSIAKIRNHFGLPSKCTIKAIESYIEANGRTERPL
jgi:hypothetical protein